MIVLNRIYQFLIVIIGISTADKVINHPTVGDIPIGSSQLEVPALGIKCNTAELKIVNHVVEMCLEDVLEKSELEDWDACQVMEKSESCIEMRSTCLDDKTLREFKDSMMDVFIMHGVKSCSLVQEYMTSQRPIQLIPSKICQPWEIFEADWDYRYCIADIVRKVITSSTKTLDAFMFNREDNFVDDEENVVDLTEYNDHLVNFCDFSQILMTCGRSFHLCYEENLQKVEILKFLNTMYWLSEYEQPFLRFSQVAGDIGLKEVLYIADYIDGQICDLSEAEDFEFLIDETNDDIEVVSYIKNEEL